MARLVESALARQQYATIAWLRWRIFANSMRRKGATAELVVRVLSYPVLALMVLGPSAGAAFAGFYCVKQGVDQYLAIPLWIIFVLWQFIGASTSSTGPSFDLSTLTRFPLRYREYLLMRLSFGLLDPPTLAGICCLSAMSLGIGVAAPALFPWAALGLAVYALCNILFSRMVYSWMERWLAQRRTRELITGLIILLSLAFQFASQFAQHFGNSKDAAAVSPFLRAAEPALLFANSILPPGLASSFIEHAHKGSLGISAVAMIGNVAFAALFLVVLHLRFHAQYLGENLSETPASAKPTSVLRRRTAIEQSQGVRFNGAFNILPTGVPGLMAKELRYLLRSGPRLYVLIMPVFVVLLFSARSTGMDYMGVGHREFARFLYFYGCAYTQLLLVGMLYNSLGSDGAGVQFYLLAPIRMRDVLMAKNLVTAAIILIEMIVLYVATALLSARAALDLVAATFSWVIFTFLMNASIGNIRSIVSPKTIDPSKLRGQNISGLSGLISVVATAICAGLGYFMFFLCRFFHTSYWTAAGVLLALSGITLGVYMAVLRQLGRIASEHVEDMTQELCKRSA